VRSRTFLKAWCGWLRAKSDFFERRGREGFAECAKEQPKKRKRRKRKKRKKENSRQVYFESLIEIWLYFLYSFGIFFFAPFAKPLRPLRSKNPPLSPYSNKYKPC
jgi:polyferredoxin